MTVLPDHVRKIVAAYQAFQTVDKYAYRATPQEIAHGRQLSSRKVARPLPRNQEIDSHEAGGSDCAGVLA